ncbi:hypothetical protein GCM10027275_50540 [Rhabdobacter roseus]|uniref:DUF1353 domain-containing protein n=1 Tax=Rhabdobacter roseus TaxID=1655419 RepID=A0A840U024_9BACT|nr:DUF1353 domain-containing protein [Rhabdobacter roseus]MBB5287127.1 hypothetical protein [Rhabdobacter roseus]
MRTYPDVPLAKCTSGKPTWWMVTEDVLCEDADGSRYIIPAGFVSNFASMPSLLYPLIPPHGPSAIPSVKHDYRYTHLVGMGELGYWEARLAADRQYYRDLRKAGVKRKIARAMYRGVRAGGWWWWNRHARRKLGELMQIYVSLHL